MNSGVQVTRIPHMPALPVVMSACAICRDDLLFELEVDAVV